MYVPPVASVKFPQALRLPATLQLLPVKSTFLKKLPESMVNVEDPALTVKLGAFDVVPPVIPKLTVAGAT